MTTSYNNYTPLGPLQMVLDLAGTITPTYDIKQNLSSAGGRARAPTFRCIQPCTQGARIVMIVCVYT